MAKVHPRMVLDTLKYLAAVFILCGMGVAAYAIISVTLETIVK